MGWKHFIGKLYTRIVTNMSFFAAVWIVAIMFLVVGDVLGRNLFHKPITGTPEIVKHSLVGITFLQIAHVLMKGRHIRSTVVLDRLSPGGKMVLEIFAGILGIVIFGLLFYAELGPAWKAYTRGEFESDLLKIPTWPTHLIILIGSFFMMIQFVKHISDQWRGLRDLKNGTEIAGETGKRMTDESESVHR